MSLRDRNREAQATITTTMVSSARAAAHGLGAVVLDALTASQNASFLAQLRSEMNLPTDYRIQLSNLLDAEQSTAATVVN